MTEISEFDTSLCLFACQTYAGLGKSTLIKALLSTPQERLQVNLCLHDGIALEAYRPGRALTAGQATTGAAIIDH